MQAMFDIKAQDMIRLRSMYKRAPREFAKAIARTLNDVAFGVRQENLGVINRRMTVRNPRFVASRIRVERAKTATSNMHAVVGSVRSPRFSGWEEQESGGAPSRHRVVSLMARKGDTKQQAASYARLKRGPIITPYQVGLGSLPAKFRNTAMVRIMRRNKWKQPFILDRKGSYHGGLFRLRGARVERLQTFGVEPKPKRVMWMKDGINEYFQGDRIRREWVKNCHHVRFRY